MLIHKLTIDDELDDQLVQTESYLINTCKEYNIEYSTCECKMIPVTEGIVSGFINLVKTIFQKVIAFLVKIWKAIVEFVKTIIKKAIELFKRLFNIKTDKKFSIKSHIISKPGSITEVNFKSMSDVRSEFSKAIQEQNAEINKLSRMNIDATKRLEQSTIKQVTEQFVPAIEDVKINADYNKVEAESKSNDPRNKQYEDIMLNKIAPKIWNEQVQRFKSMGYTDEFITELKKISDSHAISIQGDSAIAHYSLTTLSALDVNLAKTVVESENVCEMYEVLKADSYRKLKDYVKEAESKEEYIKAAGLITNVEAIKQVLHACDGLLEYGVSESEIERYVGGSLYPSFDNYNDKAKKEAAIRKFLKVRIEWNTSLIATLRAMVTKNQQILGLTTQQVVELTKDLDSGNINSTKKVLDQHKDEIISKDKTLIDGRKLGLGTIIISDAIANDADNDESNDTMHKGFFISMGSFMSNDTAISYLTKYDVTILSHGANMTDSNGETRWVIEAVKTPNGITPKSVGSMGNAKVIDMFDLLDQLVKEGYKKINVVSCNPGGVKLPERFVANHKITIHMSLTSTLLA